MTLDNRASSMLSPLDLSRPNSMLHGAAAATTTSSSSTAVDLALIHRLTNLNDINRILHETVAKERSIDNELDQLLGKRADLERSFLLLNTPTAETLELVHADCEQLLAGVQGTAQLAARISSKVRTLDLAQTRVQEALGKIRTILDRTNCINGVQAAMEAEDYEAAANYIGTFFDLEAKMAAGAAQHQLLHPGPPGLAEDGQQDAQRQVLLTAKGQLEQVVDRQLDEAVARRDATTVLRFAKLYKPLGKQAEGLRRFVEFLRLSVAGKARAQYTTLAEQLDADKKVDFHAAVASLFKLLALALEEHEAFVRDVFGPAGVLEAASGLQAECDAQGSRLLARFTEASRVERMVSEVRGRRRPAGAAGAAGGRDTGPDARQVDVLLQELLRLCQLAEEYNQFMLGKMREGGQLTAPRETAFRSGAFNVSVRELLGQYMALEEYYMCESCALALRIDESAPGALTSSCVDDVFFILRKCGLRALASGSVQCSAALLAELNNIVANTLRDALSARLALGPGRMLAAAPTLDAPAGVGGTAAGAVEHSIALNNSDVSAEYVVKLRTELEGYLPSTLAAPGDRERVRSVLSDLAKSASDLRQANTKALEQLAEATVPRLRPVLDEVAAVSYQLSDAEYSQREVEDGWAHRLLAALQLHLAWMQPMLTTNNYEVLLHLLLDKLVARLEALMGRKAFSQLGGLQLERDTRLLLSGLQELSTRTVRDKLARLSQMALLLGLESVDEVLDYWSSGSGGGPSEAGGITWRLSAAEVRAVLLQRGDLNRDAVMALPL